MRGVPRTPRATHAAYTRYIEAYVVGLGTYDPCKQYVKRRDRGNGGGGLTDSTYTYANLLGDSSSLHMLTYGPCKQTPLLNSFEFCIRCHPLRAPSSLSQRMQHCQHMSACKQTPLLNSFVFYMRCHPCERPSGVCVCVCVHVCVCVCACVCVCV
jgi:hypothetical protein